MRSGEASTTARRVAAQRLTFEREAAPFGDATADDRLARDVAGDVRVTTSPMRAYLAARTTFFDRAVVAALDAGILQVILGAAGYDGRAFRYAKPGVRWFEVDHPDTQRDKRSRLEALGLDARHITFVAADFAVDSVAGGLRTAGHDAVAPSLFTLEGVAVYLDRAVLDALLAQLRSVAGAGSRLVISLSVSGGGVAGRLRRAAFRTAVASLGEPARTVVAPEDVEGFFAAAGWRILPTVYNLARAAGLLTVEPV